MTVCSVQGLPTMEEPASSSATPPACRTPRNDGVAYAGRADYQRDGFVVRHASGVPDSSQ